VCNQVTTIPASNVANAIRSTHLSGKQAMTKKERWRRRRQKRRRRRRKNDDEEEEKKGNKMKKNKKMEKMMKKKMKELKREKVMMSNWGGRDTETMCRLLLMWNERSLSLSLSLFSLPFMRKNSFLRLTSWEKTKTKSTRLDLFFFRTFSLLSSCRSNIYHFSH